MPCPRRHRDGIAWGTRSWGRHRIAARFNIMGLLVSHHGSPQEAVTAIASGAGHVSRPPGLFVGHPQEGPGPREVY
jgi:hypothetical protein